MKLSALDIKKLVGKLNNEKLVAYMEDPKRLISSLNHQCDWSRRSSRSHLCLHYKAEK